MRVFEVRKLYKDESAIVFLLGIPKSNVRETSLDLLQQENSINRDILQGSFPDGYNSLSHKVIFGLLFLVELERSNFETSIENDVEESFLFVKDTIRINDGFTLHDDDFFRLHMSDRQVVHELLNKFFEFAVAFFDIRRVPVWIVQVLNGQVAEALYKPLSHVQT